MSTGKIGRPAVKITYVDVHNDGNDYIVGFVGDHSFVVDKEDASKISERAWHLCARRYMATSLKDSSGAIHQMFQHNLVMGKLTFDGKGQLETVDHINRIGTDNRKGNLRIVDQAQQNINQGRRSRKAVLPDDCGLTMDDIPRHIWYIKANGAHGDRFAIEFKTEGITWKTTSSKKVKLARKLAVAKEKLKEFYTLYPYLDPEEPSKLEKEAYLTESYNLIVEKGRALVSLQQQEELSSAESPLSPPPFRERWKAAGLYLAIMANTDYQFIAQKSDIIDHEKYKELREYVIAHTKEESVERIKTYLSSLKKQRYRKKIAEDSVITHV